MSIPRIHMQEIGALTRSRWTPEQWPQHQFAAAIHESAHAIVAMALRRKVTRVEIHSNYADRLEWNGNAFWEERGAVDPARTPHERALITIAAYAAQTWMDPLTRHAEGMDPVPSDRRKLEQLYREIAPGIPYHEWQSKCVREARKIMEQYSTEFEILIATLLTHGNDIDYDAISCRMPSLAMRWKEVELAETRWTPVPTVSTFKPLAAPLLRFAGQELQTRSSAAVRTSGNGDGFSGYASTFWDVDSYGTATAPGAFKDSVTGRESMIPVLWNHNSDAPVGRHNTIREDAKGLRVDIGLIEDGAEGSTLLKRLRGGVPLSMSFGFQTLASRTATAQDPIDFNKVGAKPGEVEVITKVRYWESSAVTFPANEMARIDTVRTGATDRERQIRDALIKSALVRGREVLAS